MNKVTDLEQERELNALTHKLGRIISSNPECIERTVAVLNGELDMKQETCLLAVRVPKTLMAQIDEIAREIAFHEQRKVTRNSLVVGWLNRMIKEHSHDRPNET